MKIISSCCFSFPLLFFHKMVQNGPVAIRPQVSFFSFFFLIFIYLFILAALGLRCCTRAFCSCGEWGLLFVVVRGLLIAVASLIAEHRLQAQGLQQLWHTVQQLWLAGSRAQAWQLWHTGLVAPQHVGSSRTRARTRVPCIGRQILNHCTTREVPGPRFLKSRSLRQQSTFES